MDADHDRIESSVDLGARPRHPLAVLAHLEAAGGHPSCIGSLARCELDIVGVEDVDRIGSAGHIGTLASVSHTVVDQVLCVDSVQLVLRGARQRDVDMCLPQRVVVELLVARGVLVAAVFGVLLDAPPPDVLHLLDPHQLVRVDAVIVVDESAAVRKGDHLATQLGHLLSGELSDVTRTADRHLLAFEGLAIDGEDLAHEVDQTVAGRLRSDQAASILQALPGEHTCELVRQFAVLSVEEADLAPAHSDVTSGYVCVSPYVPPQLGHERLTEAHHLVVRLSFGIEVRTSFAPTHRQAGQAVLEYLLEGEELEDGEVDRGMEAQAALVGADGAVELDAESPVHLDVTLIVDPRHPELDQPLWLHNSLIDVRGDELRVCLDHRVETLEDLEHRLMELGLVRITG